MNRLFATLSDSATGQPADRLRPNFRPKHYNWESLFNLPDLGLRFVIVMLFLLRVPIDNCFRSCNLIISRSSMATRSARFGVRSRKLSNVSQSPASLCFGTLSCWSWLQLQSLAPTNPHCARVVGYDPFSLCVIHKERLCPSSVDINRQMMMMINLFIYKVVLQTYFNVYMTKQHSVV
jgi:hypothetical protein